MPAFAADGTMEDPKKIQLSTGKLNFPADMLAARSAVEPASIEVSWNKEHGLTGWSQSDELMVISAADGKYSVITATGLTRKNLNGTFQLPASPMPPAAGPLHIYLLFASQDCRDYSASVCFEA